MLKERHYDWVQNKIRVWNFEKQGCTSIYLEICLWYFGGKYEQCNVKKGKKRIKGKFKIKG